MRNADWALQAGATNGLSGIRPKGQQMEQPFLATPPLSTAPVGENSTPALDVGASPYREQQTPVSGKIGANNVHCSRGCIRRPSCGHWLQRVATAAAHTTAVTPADQLVLRPRLLSVEDRGAGAGDSLVWDGRKKERVESWAKKKVLRWHRLAPHFLTMSLIPRQYGNVAPLWRTVSARLAPQPRAAHWRYLRAKLDVAG